MRYDAGSPAALELPVDHPRPPGQSFRGAQQPLSLSAELTAALVEIWDRLELQAVKAA